MEGERIFKSSIGILALFFLTLGCFYLSIKLFGYTFAPVSGIVLNTITAVIIIWFTIKAIKNSRTKMSTMVSTFLPLIALFFIITKGVASDINGIETYIYILHSYMTLICSMIVFFFCGRGKAIKFGLGIIYSILLAPVFFMLFIMIFFWNFGVNTVMKYEMSPNAVYLAEIVDSDQGALGGNTLVNVTPQNQDLNLVIGKLKKDPVRIYTGRWGEFETMTLRWETDEILYINENKYAIKETEKNWYELNTRYSRILGVYTPERKADFQEDTHGGFHGDGHSVVIYYLSDKEILQIEKDIKTNSKWHKYDGLDNWYLQNDIFSLPDDGFYCIYDKQNKSFEFPIESSSSYNFIYMQYSGDEKKLYIFEMDT